MRSFALTLLVAACGSPEQTVRARETELAQATADAALAWNEALWRGPCPEVGFVLVGRDASSDLTVEFGPTPGRTARQVGDRIIVSVQAEPLQWPAAIAHELGHALGIPDEEHSPLPDDLMHNSHHAFPNGRPPDPTGYDVARVCEHS